MSKVGSPAIEQSPGTHSDTVKAWRWKFTKKNAGNTAHLNIKGIVWRFTKILGGVQIIPDPSYAKILLSYTIPYWAKLHHPELPPPTLLSYATTYLTTLHLLINAAPHRAMLHLTELCCTSQSYAAPHRAMLHPTELCCTQQSSLHPIELWCTVLSYAEHPIG
jgi:hypothetical protein